MDAGCGCLLRGGCSCCRGGCCGALLQRWTQVRAVARGGSGKTGKKIPAVKKAGGATPSGVSSGVAARPAALSSAPPPSEAEAATDSERSASRSRRGGMEGRRAREAQATSRPRAASEGE